MTSIAASLRMEHQRLRSLARWCDEGREARRNGAKADANPHLSGPAREAWNDGWTEEDERLNPDPVPLLLAACESALEHMHSTLHRESRDLLERAIAKAKGAPNADTR